VQENEWKLTPPEIPPSRGATTTLWVAMIVGLVAAGLAFALKIADFLYTMDSKEVPGFAEVPVTVYFLVAGGWLAVLVWCFLTGKLRNLEQPKYDMLKQEEEYERLGD